MQIAREPSSPPPSTQPESRSAGRTAMKNFRLQFRARSPIYGDMSKLTDFLFGKRVPEAQEQQQQAKAARKECTVLVIDDDQAFLHVLRPILAEEGYNVLTSSSGTKGLNMLRYAPKDVKLVLLDYSMPTFDGAETLRFVRQLGPHAKVIAVTGMDLNLLPESFREGVEAFLHKPFQMKELLDTMDRLLKPAPPAAGPPPAS